MSDQDQGFSVPPNRYALIGYLEEALPAEEMARIEELLRQSEEWREALLEVRDDVDLGEHSVATIWRRQRLTCPARETLGAWSIGALVPDEADYVEFHLKVIGCRWCQANLSDVESSQQNAADEPKRRRLRFFESSVGMLPKKDPAH